MPLELISLTDSQASFVKTLLNSGRFADTSEVFREGLRLLQHREAKVINELFSRQSAHNSGSDRSAPQDFSPSPLAEDLNYPSMSDKA